MGRTKVWFACARAIGMPRHALTCIAVHEKGMGKGREWKTPVAVIFSLGPQLGRQPGGRTMGALWTFGPGGKRWPHWKNSYLEAPVHLSRVSDGTSMFSKKRRWGPPRCHERTMQALFLA